MPPALGAVLSFRSLLPASSVMPKSKLAPITADNPAIASPRSVADRLYRASSECVRQRHRYSALVAAAALDDEQVDALRMATLCDELLASSLKTFEVMAATEVAANRSEEWYRKASTLWQASREYERRHSACDERTKKGGAHSATQLAELTMEYDLEASALLALQHAVSAYRKVAPDAHIEITVTSKVA